MHMGLLMFDRDVVHVMTASRYQTEMFNLQSAEIIGPWRLQCDENQNAFCRQRVFNRWQESLEFHPNPNQAH